MTTARKTAGVFALALTVTSCLGGGLPAAPPTLAPAQPSTLASPSSPRPATSTLVVPGSTLPQDVGSIPLEELVIQQTEDDTCLLGEHGYTEFFEDDTSYGFSCDLATGHSTTAYIDIFPDSSEAAASFHARVDGQVVQGLHDYPFSAWETEFYIPDFGGKTRIAVLQVERWVIRVRSDDDTHFLTAPNPADVVEDIYGRMVDLGMISRP